MVKKVKNNQLISKVFSGLSQINEQKTFKIESKLFFTIFCKKLIGSGFSTETNLAKVCWKKLSEFNDFLLRWKIENNSPFCFHGIKNKNNMINQKKKLKSVILRRNY